MRKLRWMLGVTLVDIHVCTNERDKELFKSNSNIRKRRDARMRWFGHVVKRYEMLLARSAWDENVTGRRSKGRQKLRWRDVLKKDMGTKGVREQDAKDRGKRKKRARAADP